MGVIICLVALIFFTVAGAQAQELDAAAIQASLSGKRVALSCIDGTRGSGRYTMAKNFGTIRGQYQRPGSDPVADAGKVRAQGNQLCLTFKVLNDGKESCFGVRSTGPGRFSFTAAGGLVEACKVSSS